MDIYDKNQVPTGETIARDGAFLREGQYLLYVLAIIQDVAGRYLITQRSLDKHWAAGWWEVTGGGVGAGETSREAVVREAAEEVGLDVSGCELEPVYTYENVDLERGDNYIVNIYRFRLDFAIEDVKLQDSEAIDCRLATWDEIEELNAAGRFLHFNRVARALA